MSEPRADLPRDPALDELPVDPDLDVRGTWEPSCEAVSDRDRGARWPRLHGDVLAAVFLGGCVGGVTRYGAVATWPGAPGAFPWSTLAVNLVGALVLAVVVVIAAEVRPSRYLRPLLGTGFCGALTTFSSVVVAVAQLLSEGRGAVAASYLAANIVGGLATAALGLVAARGLAENRRRAHEDRSR